MFCKVGGIYTPGLDVMLRILKHTRSRCFRRSSGPAAHSQWPHRLKSPGHFLHMSYYKCGSTLGNMEKKAPWSNQTYFLGPRVVLAWYIAS